MLSGCSEEDTNKSAPSTQTTVLEVGDKNCPNGGVKIEVLIDGVVQESETKYVCHGSSDNQNNQGEQGDQNNQNDQGDQGEQGDQNDQNDQGDQGEQGDDTCANNIKPEIAIELDIALVYQAGKAYFLTVSANKAGLNYQIEAPLMEIELVEAETEVDGKYVTEYAVTPEEGAKSGKIIAMDGCQAAMSEWSIGTIGSVDISGVKIPAGSFNSSVSDAANPVSVDAFVMAKTETTVEQFKACVDAGACASDNYYNTTNNEYCNYNRGEAWLNHPMNCVNWYGAKEYCAWVGGRLPTEDEWQYAATHNGTQALETTYPWGNDEPTHCVHATYNEYGNDSNDNVCDGTTVIPWDDYVGTASAGTYSAGNSPLGLQDMAGNVWEWTNTLRDVGIRYYSLKGGSWISGAEHLPVSGRDLWTPDYWKSYIGFRCVAPIE